MFSALLLSAAQTSNFCRCDQRRSYNNMTSDCYLTNRRPHSNHNRHVVMAPSQVAATKIARLRGPLLSPLD